MLIRKTPFSGDGSGRQHEHDLPNRLLWMTSPPSCCGATQTYSSQDAGVASRECGILYSVTKQSSSWPSTSYRVPKSSSGWSLRHGLLLVI